MQGCKSECLHFHICLSVCFLCITPYICPSHGSRNSLDRFRWHFILRRVCRTIWPENLHFVKVGKNKQFIWRSEYIHDYLVTSDSDIYWYFSILILLISACDSRDAIWRGKKHTNLLYNNLYLRLRIRSILLRQITNKSTTCDSCVVLIPATKKHLVEVKIYSYFDRQI